MANMRATLPFSCEKTPVRASRGMVITNAAPGSAAGAEMLAAGGNAVDAAVASLLTLTVVEPMMVGSTGGGLSHVRLPDGRHVIFDSLSTAPANAGPETYQVDPDAPAGSFEVIGRRNMVGPSAVAVPGSLAGWCRMHAAFGRLPFADLVEPAIRAAQRGFVVGPYLHTAIEETLADIETDAALSSLLLRDGHPVPVGERLVMGNYAQSLRLIQAQGSRALHGGALGSALVSGMAREDGAGFITMTDLEQYRVIEREAVFGTYRGHHIFGPPPPASSGVHIAQMLNILENFDIRKSGFGTRETLHLLAEVMRIAFEDRRAASGDPDFVDVPVEKYMSKDYARSCLSRIRDKGIGLRPMTQPYESRNTTHVTVADSDGMIVSATHTLDGLFGACYMVPETGIIPNNYMQNFDPVAGRTMSIVAGKRVPTSMAPMIVERDGRPVLAIGLPGGVRIFPSAMQTIVNLVDHDMTLQEAVEAPRIWTDGGHVDIEPGFINRQDGLESLGYEVKQFTCIGGGMNAISFDDDGMMTGAACWRADGTPVGIGGGAARAGVKFRI